VPGEQRADTTLHELTVSIRLAGGRAQQKIGLPVSEERATAGAVDQHQVLDRIEDPLVEQARRELEKPVAPDRVDHRRHPEGEHDGRLRG
jgi:hypothetical protein